MIHVNRIFFKSSERYDEIGSSLNNIMEMPVLLMH